MKNKQVKQMICDCHKSGWSNFNLSRTYWDDGELKQCGNFAGIGFSRFYVEHFKPISLTANQLKGIEQ